MEQAILELIMALKGLAPEVWAILVKQVYVDAAGLLMLFLFVGLAIVFLWRYTVKLSIAPAPEGEKSYEKDDRMLRASVFGMITVLLGAGAIVLIVAALSKLANPEFYAINYLLDRLGQ